MNVLGKHCTHGSDKGGVFTSHDGYSVRGKLGLTVYPRMHYCWDCYDEFGQAEAEKSQTEIKEAIQQSGICGFLEAWRGYCFEAKPCAKHAAQKCWKCKGPATGNCSNAGSLVCGIPYCEKHPHEENH